MAMDAETKKRYEAWKRKKILKRVIMPAVLLFVLLIGLLAGVRLYVFDSERGESEADDVTIDNMSDTDTDDLDDPATSTNNPQAREAVEFCGDADPENAVMISDEQALSYLALVNKCYRVSHEFAPGDLSPVNVESIRVPNGAYHLMRETAARAAEELFQAAAEEELILVATSGYRSYDLQVTTHDSMVRQMGSVEAARRVSATPGHSEHQLGLALDLSTYALEGRLTEAFSSTPEGVWVHENAHRFGFIVSYPQGREEDTGFDYEPWHIRFVGIEVATEMFNTGQILEEFLFHHD